jgi:glutamate/tyrosine decarboxylase-like PLP-dependent enzyme
MLRSDNHEIDPRFARGIEEVRRRFFSRDPGQWAPFSDPLLRHLVDDRQRHIPRADRLDNYSNGPALLRQLRDLDRIPLDTASVPAHEDPLLRLTAALSKNWEDPSSVENVIGSPSDPAIYGTMAGVMANPNLLYSEYAELAVDLEAAIVRMMASLIGYDPQQATGIFTGGGTFCNLYGYLLGIRKSLPNARKLGIGSDGDYRIVNSIGGHYSNITNLSLLGVDSRKTIRIRITDNNEMDIADLERQMRACFQLGCVVPVIMLTMGTTDTFGVDRVKPVVDLRDRLCAEYAIKVKPHIHVDSAVGWPIAFFIDYDFDANPLRINHATVPSLLRYARHFAELRYADSFTIDFHKWGYVPYTSSLVMIRDRRDLDALAHDFENFSYFEQGMQSETHLHSTIECSRSATGVFGAYTALTQIGIEGYRTLIANCLQNANYFRYELAKRPGVKTVAPGNFGPSVGFRLYNPEIVHDPEGEFEKELRFTEDSAWEERLRRNSAYHRSAFQSRGKKGLYTNWVDFIAHTNYDGLGRFRRIPGEKAVFMNPLTTYRQIDEFIPQLHGPVRSGRDSTPDGG